MATFEELMKQVASLRAENTNLRRELQHNAGSISKLETDAHSMADAWTHLQHAMQVRASSQLVTLSEEAEPRLRCDCCF